jgi:hypothetical protein
MNNRQTAGLLLLGALALSTAAPPSENRPPKPPDPAKPAPEPKKPFRPWGQDEEPVGSPVEGGKVSPDGKVEITCDLPRDQKKKNTGGSDGPKGPGSGSGLCVFTSIEYAARYQNERRLFDFQKQMTHEPGGGYPSKVDKMIAKYAPGVRYVQHTGKDFELLKTAFKSGRMPAVTYSGRDVHYRGSIAHMVSAAHADDDWVCITDNNYPGDSQFVWMSPADFKSRWDGWSVFLLSPPPPPPPKN